MFGKEYNACVLVHVPTLNKTYLAIRSDWFKSYVGDELGRIYDCYIGQFNEDYSGLQMITASETGRVNTSSAARLSVE